MAFAYTIDDLKEAFNLMENWEDRYRFLIEIGGQLPVMPDSLKTSNTKVEGCTSQVWMVLIPNQDSRIDFLADSDAHIVRGLIGVLYSLYQGKSYESVHQINVEKEFESLGLGEHLSPNRRNGFFSMVSRLKSLSDGNNA